MAETRTRETLIRKATLWLPLVYKRLQPQIRFATSRKLEKGIWDPHSEYTNTEGHLIVNLGDKVTNQKGEGFTIRTLTHTVRDSF